MRRIFLLPLLLSHAWGFWPWDWVKSEVSEVTTEARVENELVERNDDNRIIVTPKTQVAYEYEDVVLDCIDRNFGKVLWRRPESARFLEHPLGRLEIRGVRLKDTGSYFCFSEDGKHWGSGFVTVKSIKSTTTRSFTSFTSSAPSLIPSTSGLPRTPHWQTTSAVNTPYPCMYGICNGTCCEINTADNFFDCASGQKISKTLVCNRVNDCEDGSDESKCDPWPSKITVLPKHRVEVYCGEQEGGPSGTLILECQSVGHPIPVIRWKKYDGHVPSKCHQFSKRGHGVLTCPNFQQSDQGAYSCVAENSVKSAESQPKSIAKCNNTIHCRGFKVINEEDIEHCIDCYCSGKSSQCQSIKSTPTPLSIPFPQSKAEIFAKEDGEILFVPTKTKPSPDLKIRDSSQEITYCSLSESDLPERSFLKSFGRHIIFPKHKGKTDFLEKAPDLIITGNGLSLMYTANLLLPPKGNMMDVAARFWPGNWHHLNKKTANRHDLMRVLANMDSLLIRCEYEQGKTLSLNKTATIVIESSTIKDWTNSISYVEKCTCPAGYDGLSCESCAAGYKHKTQGDSFICEKIKIVCQEGYTGPNCTICDTAKGYYKNGTVCMKAVCHPEGSTSIFLNTSKKCTCRDRVVGEICDRCENGSFYLHKARGCLQCWCSGVTNKCVSSNLYRTVISKTPRGGYNSSDGRNFWLLPPDFSGNRLTSYGGHLNYTMKYKPGIPKANAYLTVEILSMGDATLVYTHSTVDTSTDKSEKSWSVPLTEISWTKADRSAVTRGEFLGVLSTIKAIYIESPYHLSSGQANLTSTRMSSATPSGDGDNIIALEVERCTCPIGYTGLSCERCSEGYYRKRNGTISQCIKCNCSYCDPDFGCPDCPPLTYRDNPEEEKIPVCKPCPCNNNGVSCEKDDLNQIFCRCKPGFTGMHCENTIPVERDDLTLTISPRRIREKKAGTVIPVNCSVISSEDMTLLVMKTFLKANNNRTHDIQSRGRKIHESFRVVLEEGLQSIECYAYDADGKVAGHVVALVEDLITAIKPVAITNCYSDRIDLKESESKDIICEATGSPTPIVNWYRMSNGSTAEKLDTSDGVHTIESASLSDNGTVYTCIAENSEGDKAKCTSVLIVTKKCEVIQIYPKEVRIIEGGNASIQCTTTAQNPVVWKQLDSWFNREKAIASPRIQVQKGGILLLSNASVSDSGTYICTTDGENGKINATVSVTVTEKWVPPTVYIQEYDKTLKVGESFDIHCVANGKPIPTVTWSKVNGSLEDNVKRFGKTLTISKATVQNSGVYKCEAQSVAGNAFSYISVTVKQTLIPPKVNISSEKIEVHAGDLTSISCLAIGYPRPRLTWYTTTVTFNSSSRQVDNMVLIEPQQSIKEEKQFFVTDYMDGATITCVADNSAGEDRKMAKIKVLQPKTQINETLEFVPIGSYYEIRCDFHNQIDYKIEWEKVDGPLVGDECPFPKSLMIPSVQIQHNGTYICKDGSGSKKITHIRVVGFVTKYAKASSSYLVLPVHLQSPNEIRVELSFRPLHDDGVLLQKDNAKLNIYLHRGLIHLNISSRAGDSLNLVMNEPLRLEKWYSLTVSVTRDLVDITIYNQLSQIHERKMEHVSVDFNIDMGFGRESFFVGGPITHARHLSKRLFKIRHSHFDGCISRLSINRHEFDLVKEGSHSQNVTLCRVCSEYGNLCGDEGTCLDAPTQYGFICVCPNDVRVKSESCSSSCSGKGCETQLNLCTLLNPCKGQIHKCSHNVDSLQCRCSNGYSGTTCESVKEYSFCTRGSGYVRLPSRLLERRLGVPEVIRMDFTLQRPNGQLLWQGDTNNHLSIAVRDRKLHYVYLNQLSKLEIHTRTELTLNAMNTLMLRRVNSTVSLELNWKVQSGSNPEIYQNHTHAFYTNRVIGDIYLGDVPKYHSGQPAGLYGCIYYISFGNAVETLKKVNIPEEAVERVNVFQPQTPFVDTNSEESVDYNEADSDSSYS